MSDSKKTRAKESPFRPPQYEIEVVARCVLPAANNLRRPFFLPSGMQHLCCSKRWICDPSPKSATKAGLPKTTYIRHMIRGTQPREKPPMDYFEFMRKVYSLDNNLNQLARLGHTLGWVQDDQLQAALEDLNNLIREIIRTIYSPEKVDVREVLKRGKRLAEQDEFWAG